MKIPLLTCVLSAICASNAGADPPAAPESVEFYVIGGALHGRGDTTWTAQSGFIYSPTSTPWGIGFAYTNDGHLPNNHRDGFTIQGWYTQPLSERLELQVGTGPYASMNNTTVDNVRLNAFKMGLFSSVALKWHPFGDGWYLRSQFNNTLVPGSFNSNALLFGVGREFISSAELSSPSRLTADISVWGGTSRTTQLGGQQSAAAYQIEAQYLLERPETWWQPAAYSVAFLSEGDTGLVDRKGVPVQAWWRSLPDKFTFGFGMGPYVAYDGYRSEQYNLLGILSLRIAYTVAETPASVLEAGFMYTRVVSFYHRDQDIFMLGLRLNAKR